MLMWKPAQSLLRHSLDAARNKPGLVILLYAVGAALSAAFARLFVTPLQEVVGQSGFAAELAVAFDAALWADIAAAEGTALLAKFHHLLWIIPASVLWKAGASAGLLHALSQDNHSFWRGACRYVLRSLALGGLFLVVAIISAASAVTVILLVGSFFPGEAGQFRVWFLFAPGAAALVLSVCTVMRDVARATLVVGEQSVAVAVRTGFEAPFRSLSIWVPFAACCVIGTILAGTSVVLEVNVGAATVPSIVALFGVQQVLLVLVAAVIVGWYGSLSAYVASHGYRTRAPHERSNAAVP